MKLFAAVAPSSTMRRLVSLSVAIVISVAACGEGGGLVDPPDTRVAQVTVVGPASLQVGGTAQLNATAKNAAGETLRNKDFTWRSSNEAVATVSTQGVVTALAKGSATITATSEERPGAMAITVTVRPTIALSQEMVSLGALVGELAIDSVRVTNSGDGTLAGLTGSVVYGAGQPTGWLTATLRGPNAPAYLVLRASAANLQPGTYDAVVTLRSSEAGTAEKSLNVKFTVAAQPVPIIELSPSSVAFSAVAGQANPAARTISITNAGPGTLTGLTGVVVYPLGQPSGWLRAELNTTTAPATLTLSVNATNLQPGTYAATVTLRSSEPGVADKSLPVALTVTQAPVDRLAITPNTAQIQVGQTTTLNAVALSASGDTLRGRAVTWTSLNPAIATVDPSTGDVTVVKGIEPGVATIRATVEGKTAEATVRVVPVPVAPSVATGDATNVTATTATLNGTVDPNGTATEIIFEVSTNADLSNPRRSDAQSLGSGTGSVPVSLALTDLSPSTTYYYRLVATNSAGTSRGEIRNFTTGQTPPSAPTLAAPAISGSQVTLTWTDVSNETRYEVFRSTTSGFTPSDANRIATPAENTTTYQDTGLAADTYYYLVRACNSAGCSPASNQVSAIVVAPPQPAIGLSQSSVSFSGTAGQASPAPQTVTVTNTGGGTLSGLATSITYGPGQPTGWLAASLSGTTAPATLTLTPTTGSLPAGTYNATVTVSSSVAGVAPATIAVTFTVNKSAPAAPSSLAATAASPTQINLSWTDNSNNETGFRIERKQGAGGTYAQVATVGAGATTYQDTGLSSGTQYFYRVRACNGELCSAYSSEASATTPAAPVAVAAPSNLDAAKASNGNRIALTWKDNADNETRYEVYRSTSPNVAATTANRIGPSSNPDLPPNTERYIDDTVSKNVTYYYRVRACSTTVCSDLSNEDSATV